MESAVVAQVLPNIFVLKVGDKEYRIDEYNETVFRTLVGAHKGDVVSVRINGDKIIEARR